MTSFRKSVLPLLIVTALAFGAAACTKDKMTDNGKMMHDSGSMNKQDSDKKMSNDKGTM